MSFKLGANPSNRANPVEVADFWELECLIEPTNSVSLLSLSKKMGISDDIQEDSQDDEDFIDDTLLPDVAFEITRRINRCGNKYPFAYSKGILSIDLNSELTNFWVYLYLLIATRNNMSTNRILSLDGGKNLDGAFILESLGLPILINYFGARTEGIVFGTASTGLFVDKLLELQTEMHDGFLHSHASAITRHVKDDKLDIAVWKPFYDKSVSKLICFCQCKTGDSWHETVSDLDVDKFLKKWFSTRPAFDPIRAFMVADIVESFGFSHKVINNLFFDRCRILDYLPEDIDEQLKKDLITWTSLILRQFGFSEPTIFMVA